jgi:hypothetical protein
MIGRVAILSFISISTIHALALQPKNDETLITPTPVIQGEPSKVPGPPTTTTTPSTRTSTHLYLPVTFEPPDILGIGDVSGFYGPGAWSVWFISIVASWCRVLRASEDKFDPNTSMFLFTTNWAAVDLFRTVHSIESISKGLPSHNKESDKLRATLAAAFNVAFWGTFHAVLQLLVILTWFDHFRIRTHRLRTLILGLIIPSLALLRSIRPAGDSSVPALYWHGIDDPEHRFHVFLAGSTAIYIIPLSVFLIYSRDISLLPEMVSGMLENAIPWATLWQKLEIVWIGLCVLGFPLGMVSLIMAEHTDNYNWAFGLAGFLPFVASWLVFILPGCWITGLGFFVTSYTFRAYATRSVKASKSCFFMPCAPQSIKEEDQVFALFAGLLLFVGWEVLPVLTKQFKKRYRYRKEFVQDVENRMRQLQMRRLLMRRSSGDENAPGTWAERED